MRTFRKRLVCLSTFVVFSFSVFAEDSYNDQPPCVGQPVLSERAAVCVALFYAGFISLKGALGKEWNVSAILKGDYWYIHPKSPSGLAPDGTILFIIDAKTGQSLGGYRPIVP